MIPQFTSAADCTCPLFTETSGEFQFVGTAFCLFTADKWMTSNHCIQGIAAETIYLGIGSEKVQVSQIINHETADLTILYITERLPNTQNYFRSIGNVASQGFDFETHGYPEDTMGPNDGMQVPRLFKGHVQRVFEHSSYLGYKYTAAELSIPCPFGLSGGPIYSTDSPSTVVGLVGEHIEASTWLSTVEKDEGTRDNYHKMLNYGVAVLFQPIIPWLCAELKGQ